MQGVDWEDVVGICMCLYLSASVYHPTVYFSGQPRSHPSHTSLAHIPDTTPTSLIQPLPHGSCTHHALPTHVCTQDTFTRAKNWIRELQRQASPNIVIALSGNKVDLASKRAVDFEVGGGGAQ